MANEGGVLRGTEMATHRWEVHVSDYPEVVLLLQAARLAEQQGDTMKLKDLTERIRRYPGYPRTSDPQDKIVVVAKGGRITVELGEMEGMVH
jgi:hypothetical protein